MRILFFADNFPPETNAQASRVFERARYWIRWGHSVTVITCAPNFPDGKLHAGFENRWRQSEEMDGIRVVRVKTLLPPIEGQSGGSPAWSYAVWQGWLLFCMTARIESWC